MDIEVRDMEVKDLPSVIEIENVSFKKPWKIEDYQYEINDNPVSNLMVLTINHVVIGFIDYWNTFDSGTICKVAIKPEYRRYHFATKLMEEVLHDAYAKQVMTLTLEVRKSNVAAIKFYEKNGFSYVTTKPHYYEDGEDALYMMKKVF